MESATPRRTIGIMGGSFNPVHAGHIMLASWLAQFAGLDEVWLMLSPANPLKSDAGMASDADRMAMLEIACSGYSHLRPCAIELEMPRPSFTINSLNALSAAHPDLDFRLIIGSDNWLIFDRWRQSQLIIDRFAPMIYPRPGYAVDPTSLPPRVKLVEAPLIELSSTFIRRAIAARRDVRAFLPPGVDRYIRDHSLYLPTE